MHWFTYWFFDTLIHWFMLRCFIHSLIHWFIDSSNHPFIGSLVHSVSCAWIFHVISLAPQPPFRWCTSQLQHLIASASKKKPGHWFLIAISFFRNFHPGASRALPAIQKCGLFQHRGLPCKKKGNELHSIHSWLFHSFRSGGASASMATTPTLVVGKKVIKMNPMDLWNKLSLTTGHKASI